LINRGFKISTRYQPVLIFWLFLLLCGQPALSYPYEPLRDTSKITTSDTLSTDSTAIVSDTLNNKNDSTSTKKKSEITDPVKYSARDSLFFDMEKKTVHLYGEAHVEYQNIDLKSAYIEFNMADQTVYASGLPDSTGNNVNTPEFKEGDEKFNAHWIRYNFKSRKGFVYFVKTQQGEGTLIGDSTKRSPNGQISLKGATYSTCDLDHPHFYFHLTKAKVVPNDKIVSGPAYLVIADIPFKMIFVPFGYFPNSKTYSSGILFPSWGEETERGFYLRDGGYYFAISDYMDARITGEFFSKGSWGTAIQTNYKKRYRYSGNFGFNFNENVKSEKGLPDYASQNDYSLRWSHSQDQKASPNSSFSASVNISSTSYDKRNSYNATDYITNQKNSSVSYSHNWPNTPFSFTGSFNHDQNSRTKEINMKLPQLAFNMNTIFPFRKEESSGKYKWYENIQLGYDAGIDNRIKTYDSLFLTNRMFDNMQNGFKHNVKPSYNIKVTKSINITPSLTYSGVAYTEYNTYRWLDTLYNPSEGVYGYLDTTKHKGLFYAHSVNPSISTTYSPKLYGMYLFRDSKVKAIRHMMSPAVGFTFRPDVSDYVPNYYYTYRDKRKTNIRTSYFTQNIYGSPSFPPGKSATLSFNLNNNFEMKYLSENDTSSKEEKIALLRNFDFSSGYDLMADSFQLSNISFNTGTSVFDSKLDIQFSATFDPYKVNDRGKRVNSYMIKNIGKPARLTNANASLGTSFSSSEIKGNKKSAKGDGEELTQPDKVPGQITNTDVDYSLPWSLTVNYNWGYFKNFEKNESTITQSLSFSGDLSLTKKWKIGYTSGYDFTNKDLTFTTVNISRDLHCWQMSFSWVPFGPRQSYNFNINAKASILKDMKYNKRNEAWRGRF
jgi:hypothetical protein